jgi:beta-mannosidase
MAYYAIARAMRPIAAGISRKVKVNPRPNLQHEAFCNGKTKADAAGVIAHATPHIFPPRESTFSAWIANATTSTLRVKCRVRFISIATGLDVSGPVEQIVDVKVTGTTELISGECPEAEPTIILSEIFDPEGNLLSYDIDWPQPLKHITFPDRQLKVDIQASGEIVVTAGKPVKGLFLTNDRVEWSDNGMDIAPGQRVVIEAEGLKDELKWRYYGMDD